MGAPESSNKWFTAKAGPFGDQLGWLERDLQNNKKPWTIVYGHRPLFTSYNHGKGIGGLEWPPGTLKKTNAAFWPLLQKYGVDLYVCGHKHAYERMWPMKGNNVTTKDYNGAPGVVQIMNGAAGSLEGHETDDTHPDIVANKNLKDWG